MPEPHETPGLVNGIVYPASRDLWQPDDQDPKRQAPDPIDGRPLGEWRSRYPQEIHRVIVHEYTYLALCILLGFAFAAGAVAELEGLRIIGGMPTVSSGAAQLIGSAILTFAGGMLGGTLFSLKWLYHAVAKGMWSLDRRIWRLATPLISGVLAVAVLALLRSDVLHLFNAAVVDHPAGIFGVSFLVGYFSDVTVAKLNELAEVIFAPARERNGSSRYARDTTATTGTQATPNAKGGDKEND